METLLGVARMVGPRRIVGGTRVVGMVEIVGTARILKWTGSYFEVWGLECVRTGSVSPT